MWMVRPWMRLRDRDVCVCVCVCVCLWDSVYQPKRRWVVKWLCIPDGLCPLAVLYSWDSMNTYKRIKGQNQSHCSWNPADLLLFTAWVPHVHIYLDLKKARTWFRSWPGTSRTIEMPLKKTNLKWHIFRFPLDSNEMKCRTRLFLPLLRFLC